MNAKTIHLHYILMTLRVIRLLLVLLMVLPVWYGYMVLPLSLVLPVSSVARHELDSGLFESHSDDRILRERRPCQLN